VGLIFAALIWPLIKAIAWRMQPRMLELEERVDFTERIGARSREPDRLER